MQRGCSVALGIGRDSRVVVAHIMRTGMICASRCPMYLLSLAYSGSLDRLGRSKQTLSSYRDQGDAIESLVASFGIGR